MMRTLVQRAIVGLLALAACSLACLAGEAAAPKAADTQSAKAPEAKAAEPKAAAKDAAKEAPKGEGEKAEPAAVVYPVAILPFTEKGVGVNGYGEKVSDLLFAALAASPALYLVDRSELKKLLEEHELNASGLVAPGQANRVGQLTGAKILVTGSVVEVDRSFYLIAKIIGTETSRVLGASVKGAEREDLGKLVEQLSKQISTTIAQEADKLVAKPAQKEDLLGALAKALGKAKRPVLFIKIPERHVGHIPVDPAAQTEIMACCKEAGFEVVDPDTGTARLADVVITGEGFSEFAARHGNLISVKARLEVRAVERATDKVLAADRQVSVMVDVTEQIAGKSALQQAALEIALRMLPKVVKEWNQGPR